MATGVGYGKIILFGEHFVVHGCPAIALGISNKAIVEITKSSELHFRSDTPGTIPELTTQAVRNILGAMNIKEPFDVHLSGDLSTSGGLGSSAAFCVALVRALNEEYGLKLTNEQVNSYAYEGEKAFHGNPSGVDNTMATYGGAVKFIRGKGFQEIDASISTAKKDPLFLHEQIKIGAPLHIVVGITGISSPTVQMVAKVKVFKEQNPVQFETLFSQMQQIISIGAHDLANGELRDIGQLMDGNQKLLREIGVSIDANEKIIDAAKKANALGAKVTGGGGGGCCIALAESEGHARQVLDSIKKAGFHGFVTKVQST